MDEQHDIYKHEDPQGQRTDLPAYERTPDDIRAEARRKTVIFSVLILAFLVFAVLFALNSGKGSLEKDELRDRLVTPTQTTNAAPRVMAQPLAQPVPIDDFSFRTGSTNVVAVSDISPQKMADAMAAIRAANEYLTARDWDRAEMHITNALAIWPDMNVALRMRGVVYTQRGQFDEAIDVLERALKKDPFSAEAFNTLGTAYMQKRVFDKAEELLQTALSIRPGYAVAQVNLGLLYVLMQKYDLAVEQLEAAAPQLPDNAAIPNNLGVCLIRLARYEDARLRLQELVKADPKRAAPYFNIAITYTLQQDIANAMKWIRDGAAHCDPADVQRFLGDRDFDTLRTAPEYKAFLRELYPQLPAGPNS